MHPKANLYYLLLIFFCFWGSGLRAQDNTPPEKPSITYVTVDTATGNVNIYWEKSSSPDVLLYRMYYEVKTINGYEGITFDSVQAPLTSYTHVNPELPGKQSVLYSVSAVDSSGNESTRKPGLHGTIHNTIAYDSCSSTLTLRWSKYQGWENNTSGYRVVRKIENGTYQVIAGINANDSSYIEYEVPENTHYSFFIEGVKNNNLISSSNVVSKYTFMPDPPAELSLNYVSVADDNRVDIMFSFSDTSAITDYAVLRSSQEFSEFDPIKTYHNFNSSPQIISDSIFTPVNQYFYRIAALNTCGSIISTSNLGVNILLLGHNVGNSNFLEWNAYREFPLGIESYEVYRIDTTGSSELIGTLNSQNTFTDDLSMISGQKYSGRMHYKVKAIEKGNANFSFSNICEIKVVSDIWMPNAFTPNADGKNDIFLPRLSFNPDTYLMQIYDRYGIVIFTSKNPEIGWDGRIKGNNYAPEGVYVYHIQLSSFTGQKVNKTGHVSVFYPR